MDLDKIRSLIALLDETGTTEIEWQQGDERIRVARQVGGSPEAVASLSRALRRSDAPADPEDRDLWEPPAGPEPEVLVRSPLVGTFYWSPGPGAPPFVQVGDLVAPGQTLCIIESMKVMNEITAEGEGRVLEVLVENGRPVQFAQALFKLEPA
jgi:acetyl-CoA carboxylase biotin carboxyl carrier protein